MSLKLWIRPCATAALNVDSKLWRTKETLSSSSLFLSVCLVWWITSLLSDPLFLFFGLRGGEERGSVNLNYFSPPPSEHPVSAVRGSYRDDCSHRVAPWGPTWFIYLHSFGRFFYLKRAHNARGDTTRLSLLRPTTTNKTSTTTKQQSPRQQQPTKHQSPWQQQ